ncbi:MAG TPA: FxLYD domain-containing protein [Candidatus Acidoferrales bacterium]|nr:FxLYD domain-containing protein [Candidatus Acidoferrales bacterium]
MFRRLREFFESIAYVGLKPDQRTEARKPTWLGRLAARIERLISGRAPSDPLYLTNRSLGDKLRFWAVLIVPCLVLAGGIGIALTHILTPSEPKAMAEPSASEVAAKLLPNLDDKLKIDRNNEIDVSEIRIEHSGGSRIEGVVRNTTTHDIASVVIAVSLTDERGSQLANVNIRVDDIPASKTKSFVTPIRQESAKIALVRDVAPAR